MSFLKVDPRPRIEFYVRQGLVKRVPTDQQLRQAAKSNATNAGAVERLRFYARNPRHLLPWGKPVLQSNDEVYAQGSLVGRLPGNVGEAPETDARGLDRALIQAFKFPPLRFGVQTLYNPWNVVPTPGLEIPGRFLISHLLHTPHPTALWDVQLLHPDPGGLDTFEREIARMAEGRGPRARMFRAMAPRPGYYDYLARLVQRVRVFDYPASPAGMNPTYDNVVNYLNIAADL